MRDIQLTKIGVCESRVDYSVRISKELEHFFSEKQMFLEYTSSMETVPRSILAIPFVANVLPIIWLTDSILWIDELDRTFYDCLFRLKSAYQDLYPEAKLKGRVVVANLV